MIGGILLIQFKDDGRTIYNIYLLDITHAHLLHKQTNSQQAIEQESKDNI